MCSHIVFSAEIGEQTMRKKSPAIVLMSIFIFSFPFAMGISEEAYISVPSHRQITSYHCGPASLEMVFDFYGPDISQFKIGLVARTTYPWGTSISHLRRAAHFSRYSARRFGYAAFEHYGFTLDDLKWLINEGYPILVLQSLGLWGHYRVVVGYNSTHVSVNDPLRSMMMNLTQTEFLRVWSYSYYWGLFVCPWDVLVSTSENLREGDIFEVTATATYPCPPPFSADRYSASSSSATITLYEGLSLVSGQTYEKTLGTGNLLPGGSATVSWKIRADDPGSCRMTIMANGVIAASFPYSYKDRIGGIRDLTATVNPQSPKEALEELIQKVESWNLHKGIEASLISKLQASYGSVVKQNQKASIELLTAFMNEAEALRENMLKNEQSEYLVEEAQRLTYLIKKYIP